MARELARLLDAGATAGRGADTYHKLGPRMVGVLRELGASPAARGRPARGDEGDDDGARDELDDELDELETRRRTRADRASRVDPAAPSADA